MMPGAYSFSVFHTWVCAYEYVLLYECVYVLMYILDPVRLRLRHLYHVEFCSFIVRYPTAEGQLSFSGKRMCTILVNRLED